MAEGEIPVQHVGFVCVHRVRGVVEGEEGPVGTSINIENNFGASKGRDRACIISRDKWVIIGGSE